jgi:tetratricopeptide (TPR) repeat protein
MSDLKDHIGALLGAARTAQDAGRYDEAEALYRAAAQADPTSAAALHDLGGFYKLVGRLDLAEASLRAAHARAPDDPRTRHALGIVLMSQGRYAEGWPLYDARHQVAQLGLFKPQLPFAEWRGEDPKGKRILIFPEQGLGDQIQFSRFAPWLAEHGAEVTLVCHPALATLFRQSFDVNVVAAVGQIEFADPDYWVMSGSVAGRSGLGPESLPTQPYLRAEPKPPPVGKRIGVMTRGNPAHANDAQRSLPAEAATALTALPGALSLRPEDTGAKDFAETAAIIAGLDLVISVDTAVAHVAAALGKPTWILLPRIMTDWRWLEDRADSPWYPAARLFRQPAPGDWKSVLDEVFAALDAGPAPGVAPAAAVTAPRGGATEVARRRAAVADGRTDRARWADPANLEAAWEARAALAANAIPAGARVLDLGCGAMALERFLPAGCRYQPCDLVARDERTLVCDFNAGEFPDGAEADVAVALGVLEYLVDVPAFLTRLRRLEAPAVVSYCAAGRGGPEDRAALGWINAFTVDELVGMARDAGFEAGDFEFIDQHQLLLRLKPRAVRPAPERSVWVLSFNNVDNFGDRLGGQLLSQVLPPNACVRHVHHAPWDAPPEGDIDLLVLGLGNSLFGSLVTPELLALMDRAKAKVGIFGTQYRSTLEPALFAKVGDRLDAWFARSQEDVLLYGRDRSGVRHLGDWLVHAFPLARPDLDETLDLRTTDLLEGPLDRTIETIQRHRRVFSPRLHPLLCALCSAEQVAYEEQRPDGREPSGKFRGLLLDIFGTTRPERQFWPVDRAAVGAYKAQVAANIAELKAVIAALL